MSASAGIRQQLRDQSPLHHITPISKRIVSIFSPQDIPLPQAQRRRSVSDLWYILKSPVVFSILDLKTLLQECCKIERDHSAWLLAPAAFGRNILTSLLILP